MMKLAALLLCILAILAPRARADVLYSQPHNGSGTALQSAYWDPDGSDYDQWAWDGFMLPAAANITQIRWRGTGGTINDFEVAIYASIPAGTQPDLGYQYPGPLVHYLSGSNCSPTYAGTFGGVAMYDYSFTLPQAFLAAANTRYWVYIVAWQPGMPTWGLAVATGGNGSHFRCISGAADRYYYTASNDTAFSLIGTPVVCNVPGITQNPTPVSACYGSANATFACAATGTGTLSYRWRLNGNPVYDGPNGGGHGGGAVISGATTPTLTITNASYWADVGTYDCMVSNSCGPSYTAGALLSVPYGGPTITTNPTPALACAGGIVTFAAAAGNEPLTYRWMGDGAPLTDGPTASGSVLSGCTTPTLTITAAQGGDRGSYACAVTNPCSTVSTSAASLTVNSADFNGDGDMGTDLDIEAFFACLAGNCCATCGSADFNADGDIGTDLDIESFFRVLAGGAC
jgi:Immunoglobulin domain